MKKPSAEGLKKHCREIICHTAGRVSEPDAQWLIDHVFRYHPYWEQKQGSGIDYFKVEKIGRYGTYGFRLYRTDGTNDDISFVKACDFIGKNFSNWKRDSVIRACREAIRPQVREMRKSIKVPFLCPITLQYVASKDDVEIDHYDLTFAELLNLWFQSKDINALYDAVDGGDNVIGDHFKDKDIEQDFIKFHNANTHLRAVSKFANGSLLRKKDHDNRDR